MCLHNVNTLRLFNAYMRQWTVKSLFQVMAGSMAGPKLAITWHYAELYSQWSA